MLVAATFEAGVQNGTLADKLFASESLAFGAGMKRAPVSGPMQTMAYMACDATTDRGALSVAQSWGAVIQLRIQQDEKSMGTAGKSTETDVGEGAGKIAEKSTDSRLKWEAQFPLPSVRTTASWSGKCRIGPWVRASVKSSNTSAGETDGTSNRGGSFHELKASTGRMAQPPGTGNTEASPAAIFKEAASSSDAGGQANFLQYGGAITAPAMAAVEETATLPAMPSDAVELPDAPERKVSAQNESRNAQPRKITENTAQRISNDATINTNIEMKTDAAPMGALPSPSPLTALPVEIALPQGQADFQPSRSQRFAAGTLVEAATTAPPSNVSAEYAALVQSTRGSDAGTELNRQPTRRSNSESAVNPETEGVSGKVDVRPIGLRPPEVNMDRVPVSRVGDCDSVDEPSATQATPQESATGPLQVAPVSERSVWAMPDNMPRNLPSANANATAAQASSANVDSSTLPSSAGLRKMESDSAGGKQSTVKTETEKPLDAASGRFCATPNIASSGMMQHEFVHPSALKDVFPGESGATNVGAGQPVENNGVVARDFGDRIGRDVFASIDSGTGIGASTWVHAGAERAEAGFEDPALGWVGVRASVSGTGIHAAVVPETTAAAQAIGAHMSGIGAYLSQQHVPVSTLTMAEPAQSGLESSMDGGRQQNASQNDGQGNSAAPQSREQPTNAGIPSMRGKTPSVAIGEPAELPPGAAWLGRRISVMA